MQMGPCETLGIDVQAPSHTAKVPPTCPCLGAIARHHRMWVRMGLRSGPNKHRCDLNGDLPEISAGFGSVCALSSDGSRLAATGKQLFFKQAHIPFLYLIVTLFGPNYETFGSDFKIKGHVSRAALANRVQRLLVQPGLTCPSLWKAPEKRDVVASFAFICPLNF